MRVTLLLACLNIACITHIESGHVGVEVNSCSGGGVSDTPVGVGYHTTGPCTNIVEFPVFQQTMILTRSTQEGNATDESINVTSSEGLPVSVDCSLSYTVEEGRAPHIYQKFKRELDAIQYSYMRQTIRQGLQDVFAKYTAQQLYSDKKEAARAEVQAIIISKLGADGFNVTQFTINEARVPDEVLGAIKSKVAMTQQAQQAEQAVHKTEAEGRQKIAAATAEATAVKLRADAEAYANRAIAASLSPSLVQYKLAGKWDGKLSQYAGGGANFLLGTK
jgi:regulator of protease activity HflC (stomatin/prohibitin superfamily)